MDMERHIDVHTTVAGRDVLAGTLFAHRGRLTFRYDAAYLTDAQSFDLAPSLPRSSAPFSFAGLGPLSDSAPDRWGRRIIARSLKRARVSEIEYLLGVNDETRQGATRFFMDGRPAAGDEGVPVLTDLPALLNTADAIVEDRDVPDRDLRRLYRATGSLGGARPKASVKDEGLLWMAKFPKPRGDEWDVIGWEAATLDLARSVGLTVPRSRTLSIKDADGRHRTVLLTCRFDRKWDDDGGLAARIPYISAMTALDARDGDGGDWLDLVEFTRVSGGDTHELWKRALFGSAIGNCDDHLRNHGFLRMGSAWKLSPAFDLNPEPWYEDAEDVHQLSLFGDPVVQVESLMTEESLNLFGVSKAEARQWCSTLYDALRTDLPKAIHVRRLDSRSVEVMSSRFDHAIEQLSAFR